MEDLGPQNWTLLLFASHALGWRGCARYLVPGAQMALPARKLSEVIARVRLKARRLLAWHEGMALSNTSPLYHKTGR